MDAFFPSLAEGSTAKPSELHSPSLEGAVVTAEKLTVVFRHKYIG